jgi:hypothetical protein
MTEDAAEPHQEAKCDAPELAGAPIVAVPIALEPAEGEEGYEADGGDGDEDREHCATFLS